MNHMPISDPELKNKSILIIDDNTSDIKVLYNFLDMYGYEILVAESGKTGIEKALYANPDLILLDIVMPEMDGFETCKKLKQDDRTKKISVIMLTALSDTEHKIEGFKHGAVDYITKPIRIEEVAARVATHLKLKMLNENLEQVIDERTRELRDTNQRLKQEIENRKKKEVEIQHLRNFLHNIINSMPSMLVGVDISGYVTHWNKSAEKTTKVTASAAQGKCLPKEFLKFIGNINIINAIEKREVQVHRRIPANHDGKTQFFDVTIYPLYNKGIDGAVIRVDDVTERVRLEEVMIQTEKMMTIGGLAAGIAHEINNPLAGIVQNIQVIKNRFSDSLERNTLAAEECNINLDAVKIYMNKREISKMLDSVSVSGQRISKIINNMLSYSRKGSSVIKKENVIEYIDKAIDLARNDYNMKKELDFQKINIIRKYDKNTPKILCEASKIQQVIINLISNSAQAMADSTSIIDNPKIIIKTKPDDKYVCIEVSDNGPGMDKHTCKRVFAPFFTTKKAGVGTGLGLSISYFIITENHKGLMTVESSPGNGTTFNIRLPIEPNMME